MTKKIKKPEVVKPLKEPKRTIPTANIKLDWKAYFYRFCDEHGKWPVVDEGRLLFEDGWAYSATDYAGPEFPPPKDVAQLLELMIRYWRRRYVIVLGERRKVMSLIESLDELQKFRLVPLQQKTIIHDTDDSGRTQSFYNRDNIDWVALRGRLDWLTADLEECKKRLKELGITA